MGQWYRVTCALGILTQSLLCIQLTSIISHRHLHWRKRGGAVTLG